MPLAKNVHTCLSSGTAVSIDIFYDEFFPSGVASTPAQQQTLNVLLLVAGLNATAAMYSNALCQLLADTSGWRVIRYDNRDAPGLSTKFDAHWGQPYKLGLLLPAIPFVGSWLGKTIFSVPYTIEDHARDAWALLDFLKIKQAALLGSSMGGAIVSAATIMHPDRVLAFLPTHTSTFHPTKLSSPSLKVRLAFLQAPPDNLTKEELVSFRVNFLQSVIMCSGDMEEKKKKHGPYLTMHIQEAMARVEDNGGDWKYRYGAGRQLMALLYSDPYAREENLKTIVGSKHKIPTLVMAGSGDQIFAPDHAHNFKALIPHATVHVFEGCGHIFTPEHFGPVSQLVAKLLNSDAVKSRIGKHAAAAAAAAAN